MRWSWPSWVAITLGALALIVGLVHAGMSATGSAFQMNMVNGWGFMFLSGALLLAAGLHSLQASYDSWCGDGGYGCGCCGDDCSCGDCSDCRGGSGCGCEHCGACANGDCCGSCGCEGMRGGHEGHGHEGHEGHSH